MTHDPTMVRNEVFRYVNERENVRAAKELGRPKPWTTWPELLDNRFCNVYREDDKTTRWFAEFMRDNPVYSDTPAKLLLTTIAFRWFNKIEIGRVLTDSAIGLQEGLFRADEARRRITHDFPKGPFVTGAYVVKTPDGLNKLDGVLQCIVRADAFCRQVDASLFIAYHNSLLDTWEALTQIPYLGPFMAYEVVTDLAETYMLRYASDRDTWANPGPGAARGASRILYGDPERLSRNNRLDRAEIMDEMRLLMKMANEGYCRSAHRRPWHMREAEHLLCEVDKLFRVREGGRMKQKYIGRI